MKKHKMKRNSTFNRVMSTLGMFIAVSVVTYGFLALVNWSLDFGEWNGFSRFIMGAIGVGFIIKLFDTL